MAVASIVHHFDSESYTEIAVEVEANYPDACAEAVARCLDLWREVVAAPDEAEQ